MLRLLLKVIIILIQIPLTIIYFIFAFIGSVLAGAGWIIGMILLMITILCWVFGQFNNWHEPFIGIGVAAFMVFAPVLFTEYGTMVILKIKELLGRVV